MSRAWVPCEKCSYEEIAKRLKYEITKNVWTADICIDDIYNFMKRFPVFQPPCRLVGDTMADIPPRMNFDKVIYTYSKWNYEMLKTRGYQVELIDLPPIPKIDQQQKRFKYIIVGVSRFFDRKNLHVILDYKLREKTLVISEPSRLPYLKGRKLIPSSQPIPDYLAFSLPTSEILKLIAQAEYYLALSYVEGVGLPAIEAEKNGTHVIYVNAHGYKDNVERGISVKVCDEYTMHIADYPFRVWEPCWDELEMTLLK